MISTRANPPNRVVADFHAFVEKVRTRLPEVEIAYISIAGNPARWAQVENVKAVNGQIAGLAQEIPRLKFINVFPHMLGDDGLPRPEIFREDRLHMNAQGYKILDADRRSVPARGWEPGRPAPIEFKRGETPRLLVSKRRPSPSISAV